MSRRYALASALSVGALTSALLLPLPAYATEKGTESPALESTIQSPTILDGRTVPLEARPGFRVLPYLQRPSSTSMTINWFSETGSDATITITGPGLPEQGLVATVAGDRNPVTDYQDSELAMTGWTKSGITVPQGSWIRANSPYKYSFQADDLVPGSHYTYAVTVDGYTHEASFDTFAEPGHGVVKPLHIIAFSDTETDPVGRATYREWVKSPLADGSEERPGADSAWASKFGSSTRDGELALNYALTEDQAQELNNQLIAAADPDVLLIPGDITERASSQTHWDEWFRYFAGDKGHILDSIPVITSLGNHEVYGYGTPDDRALVVRARAAYNYHFDTFGSDNPHAKDAYHRVDYGPVTILSIDATNGAEDQDPKSVPETMKITGNDEGLTPEQYGTDTQNSFTFAEYARDFPASVAAGWWEEETDPTKPDQPDFMPGSPQYQWAEAQLADARAKGQTIIVQWHHVAYSNGTHGTTMGHEYSDAQPGTPMRHWQPLLEKYGVAVVLSGHDETFQASYVDEAGDGTGVYHWDVGIASDGLRGEKMVKNADGVYEPLGFNTHAVWMAQRNEPEMWKTNENGVPHLISGGKHYGHLDITINSYTGPALDTGVTPAGVMVMTPIEMFPILSDDYSLKTVERRELTNGQFTVYFDAQGNPLPGKPLEEEPTPVPTPIPDSSGNVFFFAQSWATTIADHVATFGRAGDTVLAGDFDGDGVDSLAIRRGNSYFVFDTLTGGRADGEFTFGKADDEVIVGDFNGDGKDTLAVKRGNRYFISNSLKGGHADTEVTFGRASDIPLAGDWDGDGVDSLALRRGNTMYVMAGVTGIAKSTFTYGRRSDQVMAGDWNGDGKDTFLVRRGNEFLISNTLTSSRAETVLRYGKASDDVYFGDWNGDGTDTPVVRR